ncbi:DUF5610 domain-containing protein [Herminiimonas aquatilis]|uniref:DUF5610 domain-containing protein n=1 Tax=Herminiimonas aquatilis TaxID=345342 RepID=A0ABW2J132_9BURK
MSIVISNTTQNTQRASTVPAASPRESTQPAADKTEDASVTDTVTLGTQVADTPTYSNPRNANAPTRPDVSAMLEESNRKVQEIINLILPLMRQQGLEIDKVVSGEQQLMTDAATIDKAKAAIAEDGEFGVRQVAERILNFAKSAIGDDPSKLAAIRAGVEKGFKEATDMLGGTLPDISQKTYAAIMSEFDRWEGAGIPSGAVSLAPKADAPAA